MSIILTMMKKVLIRQQHFWRVFLRYFPCSKDTVQNTLLLSGFLSLKCICEDANSTYQRTPMHLSQKKSTHEKRKP